MGAAMGAAKDLNTVTVPMLVQELEIMLDALNMDTKLYSLYSLRQGGATTAYWAGVGQIDIKWQTPCHEHLLSSIGYLSYQLLGSQLLSNVFYHSVNTKHFTKAWLG